MIAAPDDGNSRTTQEVKVAQRKEHGRRIWDLPQQFGIGRVRGDQHFGTDPGGILGGFSAGVQGSGLERGGGGTRKPG
jgi:hypothetical protein